MRAGTNAAHHTVTSFVRSVAMRCLLTCTLSALAYWGNTLIVPISFGVHFIFGSIAVIIAAVCCKWWEAAFVALIGSIPTLGLWHHTGYIPLALGEAVFVAVTYRRFWNNPVVATTVFWLLPGTLLFLIFYQSLWSIDPRSLAVLWSQQCINSIFNALFASGLLLGVTLINQPGIRIPLQQAFFNTLVAVVFIPILAIVVFSSRERMRDIQSNVFSDTHDQAKNILHYLTLWRQQNLSAVASLARVAQERGLKPSPHLQRDMRVIHETASTFYDMFVANKAATTFGFDPPVGPNGESLIGINFADRRYFLDIAHSKAPLVSNVIRGRGGIDFPIICFVVPLLDGDATFAGFALGSYDVRKLAENIHLLVSDPIYDVTLSDAEGTIITSTAENIQPLSPVNDYFSKGVDQTSPSTYKREPAGLHPPSSQKWQNTLFGTILQIPALGWTIRVETSLGHFTREITASYIESFGQMLALTLAGMALSFLIIQWVSRPIGLLATLTTHLIKHPLPPPESAWPSSRFAEIAALVKNFAAMTEALRRRFKDLNREIDERKSTEKRLHIAIKDAQAANVAKSEFLANMSHEIRTPLAAIIGYTELLHADDIGPGEKRSSLDAIRRNSIQLSQLINDILDLAKIEAGHLKIQPEWISLDDIVAGGVEALNIRAEDKGLSLNISGEGFFPNRVLIDPTRLNQILLNIVGNALKFTEKGSIRVHFSIAKDLINPTQGTLIIVVEDTGVGISLEAQRHLFKPFVQGDATHARRYGGTGLGLALSRTIAAALGGRVTLVQSHPHLGSTFKIQVQVGLEADALWYPDLTAARRAAKIANITPLDKKELLNKQILLVEDSPDNRMLVSRMLTRYGARVMCASGGDEGITMAQQEPWDVILMDMQMPITDGYQATRILRKKGYVRPIIALTAHALPEERERCLAAGCDEHVTKPVPWGHLISVIHQLCDGMSSS